MTSQTDEYGQVGSLAVSRLTVQRFLAEHPALLMWLTLLAGVAVRIVIAPLGAHAGDYATFTNWANALGSHSLLDIYRVSSANYPPLALLLLDASHGLFSLLSRGQLTGRLWLICLKLPPILADTGIGWLVWRAAARRGVSLWLPVSMIFNPVLIYLSGWWGQYDSIYMFPALASLLAVSDSQFFWAGFFLGAGVMIKLQTGLVAPVLALAAIQNADNWKVVVSRLAKTAAGGVLVPAACLGPYVADGQLELLSKRLVAVVAGASWPTVNALNGWYVFTLGKGNWVFNQPLLLPDTTQVLPGVSLHTLGLILVAAWLVATLWFSFQRHRDGRLTDTEALIWAGAMLILGVYLWATQIHERYAFGAIILTGTLAVVGQQSPARRATWIWIYGLLTVLHLLNLIWAGPFTFALYKWYSEVFAWGLPIALATIAVALWLLAPPHADPAT